MPAVYCLLTHAGRLLMERQPEGRLALPAANVETGESPLSACLRKVQASTGFHVSPSCAGVYMHLKPGQASDYGLAFVAEIAADELLQREMQAGQEWLTLEQVALASDVTPVERELIPSLLTTDHPILIVLGSEDQAGSAIEHVLSVSPLDPARLSPLVFAVQT